STVSYRIEGLKNEPQKFNNQGPANLAIVLNYYGDDTTQAEAASYLKGSSQDRNVSPWQISEFVNKYTQLNAIASSNGSQELLQELIANDFPVVIETGFEAETASATSWSWYGHYRIIFGFDNMKQEYNTIDTFLGPFTENDLNQSGWDILENGFIDPYDHLLTYWQQFNYTFYVVYEPTRQNELYAILGDDHVSSARNWEAAIDRAESDIAADPANAFAWFNLGTSLTNLGSETKQNIHFENAAEAFDQALSIGLPDRMLWYQHGPFSAYIETGRYQDALDLSDSLLTTAGGREIEEAWLYRGHAQALLQDYEGALDSYDQAISLNERFYPAQFGKEYVESLLSQDP
ncbi:MAG: C39 family peptidase, partial [Chloroflexota bacterium]